MKHLFICCALLSLALPAAFAGVPAVTTTHAAGVQSAQSQQDDKTIRSLLASIGKYVEDGDVDSLAALWTKDGTYTDDTGTTYDGREAVKKHFSATFATGKKPAVILKPHEIRLLAKSFAICDGTVLDKDKDGSELPDTSFLIVWTKEGNNWLIASATETDIEESAEYVDYLKDLSWMVGDWKTEHNGSILNLHISWSGDHNFLRCLYDISKPGQPVKEDTEVIGFDPRSQQLVSWNFDSTGAVGQNIWRKDGKQWQIDCSSTERDGSTVTARNIISDIGKDAFTWQSVDRMAAGQPLSDTAELKIVRTTKSHSTTTEEIGNEK